jgi:uncharacterized protein (DUF2164 family)
LFAMKWPREQKLRMIDSIQAYYAQEREETIGSIAAEQILDEMIRVIGPYVYNQAIADARSMLNERLLSLEDELYTLEKKTN